MKLQTANYMRERFGWVYIGEPGLAEIEIIVIRCPDKRLAKKTIKRFIERIKEEEIIIT